MGLFIPTSRTGKEPFTDIGLQKGQLYNLDTEEWLTFQFNPEIFSYSQQFNWGDVTWKGAEKGGDLQYVGSGPRTFNLELVFVADPHAPGMEFGSVDDGFHTRVNVTATGTTVDFEFIETMLNHWTTPLEAKRRPSRIKIIIGPRYFRGVITSLDPRLTEFFPDMTVREAEILIGFREWEPLQST